MSKKQNNNNKIPTAPPQPAKNASLQPKKTQSSKTETPNTGVPSGIKPTGVWTTVHSGVRVGDRRAGRLEKRAHATGIYIRGEERIGGTIAGTYAEGGVAPRVTLNPQTWGPRTKLLCYPYAKFLITMLRLRWVTGTPTTVNGVLYMGAYLDPAQPVPEGSGAPTLWTELGENCVEFSVYANAVLDVALRLDEQTPLFIDNTDEARFGSQGTAFIGGGTATGTIAGQFFIEYECKLIDENMEAFPSGVLIGSSDAMISLASGYEVFRTAPVNANVNAITGAYSNFVGDRSLLVAVDTVAAPGTAPNMIFPQTGYYCLTVYFNATTGAAIITGPPIFTGMTGITFPAFLDYGNGSSTLSSWLTSGISAAQVPSNRTTNSGASSITVSTGVLSATFFFSVDAPNATALFTAATCSAGTMRSIVILSRILTSPGLFGVSRPGPLVVNAAGELLISPSTFDYLQNTTIGPSQLDDTTLLTMTRLCANAAREDYECANICIAALDLPLPPFTLTGSVGAVAQFHPAIINIGAWLLRTFGPVLAEKMLAVAKERIDSFLKKHHKNAN
jgi:hypothetical protein